MAAVGKTRLQGTTGDVAKKAEADALPLSAPPSRSRKSPECKAERGRTISKPADAWFGSGSGVAVRDTCRSLGGVVGVFERPREDGGEDSELWLS